MPLRRRPLAFALVGAASAAFAAGALAASCDGCGAAPVADVAEHGPGLDNDAGPVVDNGDGGEDGGVIVACASPAPSDAPLAPEPGALFYEQLGLGGLALGESALLVAPDERIVLVDVGNDAHADDVIAAVDDVTEALGLPAREVDDVIVTHFHADHADGLAGVLDAVAVRGRVIFRGFVDVDTANPDVVQHVCAALAARPGLAEPVCDGVERAPCDPQQWHGAYEKSGCRGLGALAFGDDARLSVVAASGDIRTGDGEHAFEDDVGPLRTDDTNGENARSLVVMVEHGPFRMLLAGDLTGGGSDTDAVEPYYAPHLAALLGPRGVDVMHASHHGRDTSSTSAAWVAALLPDDGRARNVVMGISTAHLGSPHQAVLDAVLDGDRLRAGRAWTTRVAAGGATDAALVDAGGGRVLVKTVDGGRGYLVQAVDDDGAVLETRAFTAARCP